MSKGDHMQQQELIHEDWRDALRHVVKALGGVEAVGVELWPGKTRKAAGSWLSDCLNPERHAKLDLDELVQLLRMGRAKGVHLGLHYLCEELGYSAPTTIEPADREADLTRQVDRHLEQLTGLLGRLERLRDTETVRAVRAAR